MMRKKRQSAGGVLRRLLGVTFALSTLAVCSPNPAGAQEAAKDASKVDELERKVDVLTFEIERLKTGEQVFEPEDAERFGFGPSFSAVYRSRGGVSLAGYGEMLYQQSLEEDGGGTIDFVRAVLYVGKRLSDRITFNSELEFEHASTGKAGEVAVETAYLDFELIDQLGIRAGLLLLPMGLINEMHEPPIYLGTTRPETERRIIPSTWRENGAGLFGSAAGLVYRAYVVNGMDASGFDGSGLRGGRQKGSKALADDFAFVGRLDYVGIAGLLVGGSAYVGQSGQDADAAGKTVDALTTIVEGHADFKYKGLQLRGLVAYAYLGDAEQVNALNDLTGADSVGEELLGYYLQAGYDVLSHSSTGHQLIPMVRYEWLDTQLSVPDGFAKAPARERHILAAGASYLPIPQVVLKADYQLQTTAASGDEGTSSINFALGYMF